MTIRQSTTSIRLSSLGYLDSDVNIMVSFACSVEPGDAPVGEPHSVVRLGPWRDLRERRGWKGAKEGGGRKGGREEGRIW